MIPEGWEITKWGEIVTLEYGKSLTNYRINTGDIPVYGTNGLIGYTETPLCKFPSVVIGRKGAYRGVHYSKTPFFVIDTAFYLNPIYKELDLKFAYYQLLTQNINQMDSGSAIPSTSREDFYNLNLLLPDIKSQRRIASILSSLDDKIELNFQMNKTLESIAQAIFKEWFVDFRFPGFDGELMDGLPRGWKKGNLTELLRISKETISPSENPDKFFSHYSIPAYDDNKFPDQEEGKLILSNKNIVKSNSILFSKLNPRIPRVWPILEVNEESAICSTEFLVLLPKEMIFYSFILNYLHAETTIGVLQGLVTGTSGSHQRIRPDDLLTMELIIPENELLNRFNKLIKPMVDKSLVNTIQNQFLSNLRDLLLPKLMTGKIRVA